MQSPSFILLVVTLALILSQNASTGRDLEAEKLLGDEDIQTGNASLIPTRLGENDAESFLRSRNRNLQYDTDEAILCLEVKEIPPMVGDTTDVAVYTCILDSRHTGGVRGLIADIVDPDDHFIEARETAMKEGKASLYVVGGILSPRTKGRLTFPSGEKEDFLIWFPPFMPPSDSLGALSTVGSRSVLIVRITALDNSPSHSASRLSDAAFGTSGRLPNMQSQYSACSNNQLQFYPVSGSTPNGQNIVDGLVQVSVSENASGNHPHELSNAALIILGNLLDIADHVFFIIPFGTVYDGGENWVAHAYRPGESAWYNHVYGSNLNVLMHETGHNLGLWHSGEGSDQYNDHTCNMGNPLVENICFNAAKMAQFEWFDDRTIYIYPDGIGSFSGSVIGVNDYANSIEDTHYVVVVIVEPGESSRYFLTYNRAEGITADTKEAIDEVTVVTSPDDPWSYSYLVGKLGVGETFEVEDFGGSGQTLEVSVTFMGVDAGLDGQTNVDVATVNVAFVGQTPVPTAEHSTAPTLPDCGDGVCDAINGENCGTCPADCIAGNDCVVFEFSPSPQSEWGTYYDNRAGLMFDVEAMTDIQLHGVSFFLVGEFSTVDVTTITIYTKSGSMQGFEKTPGNWDLVCDSVVASGIGTGVSYATEIHEFSVPIEPSNIAAGTKRAFYVTSESQFDVLYVGSGYEPDSPFSAAFTNADMIIYGGARTRYPFKTSTVYMHPKGTFSYVYVDASDVPESTPSLFPASHIPTTQPTLEPSTQATNRPTPYPTRLRSAEPTVDPTPQPTNPPTHSPSPQSTPHNPTAAPPNPLHEPSAVPTTENPPPAPTLSPTPLLVPDICGNGVCEVENGESCLTCPADCNDDEACILFEFPPGSVFAWATYYDDRAGIMFDVEALTDITVFELSFFLEGEINLVDFAVISIYTREGSFVGFESSPEDWELVADSVEVGGIGTGSYYATEIHEFIVPLTYSDIAKGSKRAFYITAESNEDVLYVGSGYNASSPLSSSFANDDIIVYDGQRISYPFGSTGPFLSPKGTMSYAYAAATSSSQPTSQPTPQPVRSPTQIRDNDDNACFATTATTQVRVKGLVEMNKVVVGDEVMTADGSFKSVYAIDHFHKSKPTTFLQIHTTAVEEKPLELTPLHMLFVEGQSNPIPASQLQVGDTVQTMTRCGHKTFHNVTRILPVSGNGFYNVLTLDGTIVVNGVICSSYPAITGSAHIEIENIRFASLQTILHLALMPIRIACLGLSLRLCSCDEHANEHFAWYSRLGNSLLLCWTNQYAVVQECIAIIAILLLLSLASCAANLTCCIWDASLRISSRQIDKLKS